MVDSTCSYVVSPWDFAVYKIIKILPIFVEAGVSQPRVVVISGNVVPIRER